MTTTTIIIIAIVCLALGILAGFYLSKFIKMSNKDKEKLIRQSLSMIFSETQKKLQTEEGQEIIENIRKELIKAYPQLNEVLTKEQFATIIIKIISQSEQILLEGDENNNGLQ